MANKNRVCLTCGTEYKYCQSCSKDADKPSWMALYCSKNCKTIFDAANKSVFGFITNEEAKAIIEECDLTNLETFNEIVKNDVKKILDSDVEPKKASKKAVKDVQPE